MATSNIFQTLSPLSFSLGCFTAKPCKYKDDQLIFATDGEEDRCKPGIYQYNLSSNQVRLLHEYKEDYNPQYHAQVIDLDKNQLYITATSENETVGIFDLTTNKMEYKQGTHLPY